MAGGELRAALDAGGFADDVGAARLEPCLAPEASESERFPVVGVGTSATQPLASWDGVASGTANDASQDGDERGLDGVNVEASQEGAMVRATSGSDGTFTPFASIAGDAGVTVAHAEPGATGWRTARGGPRRIGSP